MTAYSDFADVYDIFMEDTPYEAWADYIAELIAEYGVSKPYAEGTSASDAEALDQERNLVVELGCGTGSFTEELAARGYDMVGIDNSWEMLDVAREKQIESGLQILYLEQDMRELDLYCTAGTIVSVCDSINYVTDEQELEKTFRLVNNFLFPGGLFLFDFNTEYKYRDVIGNRTIAESREECSFIWENWYHQDTRINEYDVTFFKQVKDDLFRRSSETHFQRGYTVEEMDRIVRAAGLMPIRVIDADTHREVTENSERVYFLARECGKQA